MDGLKLDLSGLRRAVAALDRSLTVARRVTQEGRPADELETVRAGVIQSFEFSYESCWKMIKRRLADDLGPAAVEGLARRQLFRLAAEHALIGDVERWMLFHAARNRTAHTYDSDVAKEVERVAVLFAPEARALLAALEVGDA